LTDYVFSIQGGGYDPSNDPDSIGRRFLKTLDALSQVDRIFSDWVLTDHVKLELVNLAAVRSRFGAFVERNVETDDDGEPDPAQGYRLTAFNSPVGGPRTIALVVRAGRGTADTFELSFGGRLQGVDPALINYPLFKASLLAIVANWRCAWATAIGFKLKLRHVPIGPVIRVETDFVHRLTWIAYLPANGAPGHDLPPGLIIEPTPEGGFLMIAADERPDPSNAAQMKRADFLTTIMEKRASPRR